MKPVGINQQLLERNGQNVMSNSMVIRPGVVRWVNNGRVATRWCATHWWLRPCVQWHDEERIGRSTLVNEEHSLTNLILLIFLFSE